MDLLLADTAILFPEAKVVRERRSCKWSYRVTGGTPPERRNGNLISELRFLSRKPIAGSQAELLKFVKDLHSHLQQPVDLLLSMMLVHISLPHHPLLPWILPAISLASWLNPILFPIEAPRKTGPRRLELFKAGGEATTKLTNLHRWLKVVPHTFVEEQCKSTCFYYKVW